MITEENIKLIKREEYAEYLSKLSNNAFQKNSFSTICSFLRVGGLQDANWDPFEESQKAAEDYNWLLKKSKNCPSKKGQWRIGLLIYCQAIEMTAPHELLANILRMVIGEKYHINPFRHLRRVRKKLSLNYIPSSAKSKFNYLKELATKSNENKLIEYINSFYDDKIRNSFFHSDYIMTNKYFRWTEGGPAQQISLNKVNVLISNCIEFYSAILWWHKESLKLFGRKLKKYYKWPQYEILELLSNKENGLYGFSVHFSNGSKATYSRTKEGTNCTNVRFEKDGSINYFIGSREDLEPVWKINGVPINKIKNISL